MLGFVFPGETAAILGGVLASKGGVSLGGIVAVVVLCAIVGDSVGYAVGDRWGRQLLQLGPLRKRQKGIDTALDQLNRRGADRRLRRPLLRLPARRRPGPGRHVQDALPHLPARQRRRRHLLGGPLRPPRLLRRRSGSRRPAGSRPTSCSASSSWSSSCSSSATAARRSEEIEGPVRGGGARERRGRLTGRGSGRRRRGPSGPRRAGRPATRANSPAASSPWASVSIQRTAAGSLRSSP